jgi:hypothetical protein
VPAQYRAIPGCVAVSLAAFVLAACGSSGPAKPADTTTGSETSQASAQTSTPPAPSGLSKADFVSKANALCRKTVGKIDALPTPSGPTDYAAIVTSLEATLALFPQWLGEAKALVAQSSDEDELTSKWLALDESDFNAQKALFTRVLAAAKAKNATETAKLAGQLGQAPSHSDGIAKYLTSYGLTDCAKLESG